MYAFRQARRKAPSGLALRHTTGRLLARGSDSGTPKNAPTPPRATIVPETANETCGLPPLAASAATDMGTPTAKPPPTARPKYRPKLAPMVLVLLTSLMKPCQCQRGWCARGLRDWHSSCWAADGAPYLGRRVGCTGAAFNDDGDKQRPQSRG